MWKCWTRNFSKKILIVSTSTRKAAVSFRCCILVFARRKWWKRKTKNIFPRSPAPTIFRNPCHQLQISRWFWRRFLRRFVDFGRYYGGCPDGCGVSESFEGHGLSCFAMYRAGFMGFQTVPSWVFWMEVPLFKQLSKRFGEHNPLVFLWMHLKGWRIEGPKRIGETSLPSHFWGSNKKCPVA